MPSSDPLEVPRDLVTGRPTCYWHVHFYNHVSGERQRIGLGAPYAELAERWAWRGLCQIEREKLRRVFGTWTEIALDLAMSNWRRTGLVQNPREDPDEDEGAA